MSSLMVAADVVTAAIEIEKRGKVFYETLAATSGNADKAFFLEMAHEEMNHQKIFENMLGSIGGVAIPASATDEEYFLYIQDLIDSHMLMLESTKVFMKQSPLEAAIQLEKDTLLFFLAIESLVPESEASVVRACANEERKHLRRLAARKTD